MNQSISKFIRNKHFFSFWIFINRISIYGMNYGVASGYADYSGELYIIKKVGPHLKEGIVFDVGANIGDWSKFVLEEYSNKVFKLFAFEPSKPSFEKFKLQIDASDNVIIENIGFGDKKEKLEMSYEYPLQGSSGLFNEAKNFTEEIELTTLDNYCSENEIVEIDFLKMDVQGFEYAILKGSQKMLGGSNIRFIQFELDEPAISSRIFFKDFWELLSPNYRIYHSLYNGLIEIKEYSYTLENYHCMNYLAVLKTISLNK